MTLPPDDDRDRSVRDALGAIAAQGGDPDEAAAWSRISTAAADGERRSRRQRLVLGVSGLAVASAAAALIVVLVNDGDDRESVDVIPAESTTTTTEATSTTVEEFTTTTAPEDHLSGTVPSFMPASPLFVATTYELQLWDGDTGALVGTLANAGVGRPDTPEGYRYGPLSYGAGQLLFTEYEGPEDHPSIWSLDVASGIIRMVVASGTLPAISPDGSKLAYVEGSGMSGVAQTIIVSDLMTGDERRIEGFEGSDEYFAPSSLRSLEWSPDGSRLLVEDRYEQSSEVVLDPATDVTLSDAVFLEGENIGATWLDDATILAARSCCYPDSAPDGYIEYDARTGAELRRVGERDVSIFDLAAGPGRRVAYLEQSDPTTLAVGTLSLQIVNGEELEIPDVRSMDW